MMESEAEAVEVWNSELCVSSGDKEQELVHRAVMCDNQNVLIIHAHTHV